MPRALHVGGSDDHSGINPGRTWTRFEYQDDHATPNALIESIRRRETRPDGAHGGPITLAHSLLKLLYDGSKKKTASAKTKTKLIDGPIHSLLQLVFESQINTLSDRIARKGALLRQIVFGRWGTRSDGLGVPFETVLESEVGSLLASTEFRATLAAKQSTDDRIFLVISTLINRIFARYLSNLKKEPGLNLVGGIKEVVALISSNVFVSLPYLISFLQQASDCLVARDVRKAFQFTQRPKIALLTDTFFEVNGVSRSIKRMLLAGYAYAHALERYLTVRWQIAVHALMMFGVFLFLPLHLGARPDVNASAHASAWLLWQLTKNIGVPFCIVSSTAPLLQNWLSKSKAGTARDPYFLYAISNAGSLIGLLAYPLLIEPRIGVRTQSWWWYAAYGLLTVMVFGASRLLLRSGLVSLHLDSDYPEAAPSWRSRLFWLAAAFVPSALMLAVTNHILLNLASVPFLWVIPLAAYLITFMVAFGRRIHLSLKAISRIVPAVLLLLFPFVATSRAVQTKYMISLADLLRARTRDLDEERRRERLIKLRFPLWSD